ncbi:MAG: YeeE/YedE family protein [Devosiaceae bacterium]|nr:YeeE/YedE family protein [Devosiaceae bacterium]
MEYFTPVSSLIGGLMIGLASAILWVGNGRIAGISGIFGQILPPPKNPAKNSPNPIMWRVLFLVSMIIGGFIASVLLPNIGVGGFGGDAVQLIGNPLWIASAGLLVGLGTKIGNGCTSGHGVSGLARFSLRSLVAVLVFFATAAIIVAVTGIV